MMIKSTKLNNDEYEELYNSVVEELIEQYLEYPCRELINAHKEGFFNDDDYYQYASSDLIFGILGCCGEAEPDIMARRIKQNIEAAENEFPSILEQQSAYFNRFHPVKDEFFSMAEKLAKSTATYEIEKRDDLITEMNVGL